jgi:hypothetical protein
MGTVLFIVLAVVILLLAMFAIPHWRIKRAVSQVIQIFRDYNAVGIKNAKTIDELGLRPRGMMDGMFKGRDYRQYALSALVRSEIIQMTEDGRLYLSEDKLLASGLGKPTPYYH